MGADRSIEIIRGNAPLILIAPHGGRGSEHSVGGISGRKVNDLYTAEMTRELARLLDANALINAVTDRNELDYNRISEICDKAPSFLTVLAEIVDETIVRNGVASVLLIHGWNVIQPRADIGIGARIRANRLTPVGAETLTAGVAFIENFLFPLVDELRELGIICSFGLRYPGASRNNLLQAFTPRHRGTLVTSLRKLADLATAGLIDAAQLELSIPLRWPGRMRTSAMERMKEVARNWLACARRCKLHEPSRRSWVGCLAEAEFPHLNASNCHQLPTFSGGRSLGDTALLPEKGSRYGLEFYDATASIGGIISLRTQDETWRASMLLVRREGSVAIFSTEDDAAATRTSISVGGIGFKLCGEQIVVSFDGPVLFVPDALACVNLERALALGHLVNASVTLRLRPHSGSWPHVANEMIGGGLFAQGSRFGRTEGQVQLNGQTFRIDTFGRIGRSPNYGASIAPQSACSLTTWVYLATPSAPIFLEMQAVEGKGESTQDKSVRIWKNQAKIPGELRALELRGQDRTNIPDTIRATVWMEDYQELNLEGRVATCLVLAHASNRDTSPIYTTLGFTVFPMSSVKGVGTFWLTGPERPPWVAKRVLEEARTEGLGGSEHPSS